MAQGQIASGIVSGRLSSDELTSNFTDLHPPLAPHEAAVAAIGAIFVMTRHA